jgi:hypothetical protein
MPFVQSTVNCGTLLVTVWPSNEMVHEVERATLAWSIVVSSSGAVVSTRRIAIRRLLLEPPQYTRELFASSAAARPPSGKAVAEPS